MRHRKKSWTEKELSENNTLISDATEYKGKWKEFFGNDNPIHIEIGCGKGGFITELSKRNADINYIGIEREKEIMAIALKRSRENGIGKNVAFAVTDAANLTECFEKGEVERIYLNFSDPWHRRKKWAKKRLTYRTFLAVYEQIFPSKGELFLKTDNKVLFESSLNEIADRGWRLHNITFDLHNSDYEGNIMTEYEKRFSELGQPIYRLEGYFNED
ncbi:MAG TPA: tRNA (guanosine(46)-N7)-methyltransferase TrmB [Lachnospiraceae bacterium]|nr:tRNA (guanosine(46)-N7)-methyltransferase TrmB [Lachnospiraceae bacterium]